MNTVRVKKLDPNAILPTYGSASAAGADLYACETEEITIKSGETVLVHTGIALEQTIAVGERIAQLVITPYITAAFCESDELDDTVRGAGGFGSTGVK